MANIFGFKSEPKDASFFVVVVVVAVVVVPNLCYLLTSSKKPHNFNIFNF